MGRFGWAAGHSKQGSDKSQFLPHEWFNKSTVEPSRQALGQLRRDLEDGGQVPSTTSPRSRSRSGTVSSTFSFYAKSISDKSNDAQTRPPSRQSVVQDTPQDSTRADNVARSFFSKGSRMIRRQGSKLTMGPSQVENGLIESGILDSGESSVPKRGLSSKSSGHRFNLSGSQNGSDIKTHISGPYGFQHVSHTDQGHFQSLNKVSKLDLVHEFTAVQEGQIPAVELRGIAVGDLPSSATTSAGSGVSPPLSPTSSIVPDLPSTPPRPTPPPKDNAPPPPKTPDVRLSRSVENFSRPTRSPIRAGFEISTVPESCAPVPETAKVSILDTIPQSPSGWAEETFDKLANVAASRRGSLASTQLVDKPLPHTPTIVHAVSTNDESALPLRNTPLPELPQLPVTPIGVVAPVLKDEVPSQEPQITHRISLRHAQSFPITKLIRRRSQSSGDIPIASSFTAPTSYTSSPSKAKRISIGIKKIDIEDWENAIDYAWDHPLDMEEVGVPAFDSPMAYAQTPPSRPESFLVVSQPPSEPVTQPSTPLMMQAPNRPLPTPDASKRFSTLHRPSSKLSLQGLGIAAPAPQRQAMDHSGPFDTMSKHESLVMPHSFPTIPVLRREPSSPISKSSSQESIILSIASSIMGTHRSSNSSTSLGDLSNLVSIEDANECDLLRDHSRHNACDNNMLRKSASSRPSDDSNRSGNTSDGSQETVKTDIVPEAPTIAPPPPPPEQAPLPPKKHVRTTSIPRANVPNRTSSIAAPAMTKGPAARARSNTLAGRPRYNPSRASYSLFPSAQPPTPSTPITPTP